MINSPCQYCNERTSTCHSECKKYKAYREEHEKEKKRINKIKAKNANIEDFHCANVIKAIRRRGDRA